MNKEEEMFNLNKEIEDKEKRIWENIQKTEDMQAEVDLETAKLEQDITSEKDLVTGKNMYTNESARGTALKIAIQDNKDLKEKLQEIQMKRNAMKIDEITVASFKRKLSIQKAFVYLQVSREVNAK